jgi:REP element-mobilizing transposase RayT
VTVGRCRRFADGARLDILRDALRSALSGAGWAVSAWVVLPDHYHVVATSPGPGAGAGLVDWVTAAHLASETALNRLDGTAGRAVWSGFHLARIPDESAFHGHLRRVIEDPVAHGWVGCPETWPYGTAAEWRGDADPRLMARVMAERPRDFEALPGS